MLTTMHANYTSSKSFFNTNLLHAQVNPGPQILATVLWGLVTIILQMPLLPKTTGYWRLSGLYLMMEI